MTDEYSSGIHVPIPRANEAEARRAAKTKAKQLKRDTVTGSFQVIGDPKIRAGMDVEMAITLPGVDGVGFMATSAVHEFSKSGYTTSVDVELKV